MTLSELASKLNYYSEVFGDKEVKVVFCYDKIGKDRFQYMSGEVTGVKFDADNFTIFVDEYSMLGNDLSIKNT